MTSLDYLAASVACGHHCFPRSPLRNSFTRRCPIPGNTAPIQQMNMHGGFGRCGRAFQKVAGAGGVMEKSECSCGVPPLASCCKEDQQWGDSPESCDLRWSGYLREQRFLWVRCSWLHDKISFRPACGRLFRRLSPKAYSANPGEALFATVMVEVQTWTLQASVLQLPYSDWAAICMRVNHSMQLTFKCVWLICDMFPREAAAAGQSKHKRSSLPTECNSGVYYTNGRLLRSQA